MKCHSWRFESETGAVWKVGFGLDDPADNSAVSLRRRRTVGEGAIAVSLQLGRLSTTQADQHLYYTRFHMFRPEGTASKRIAIVSR